MTEPYPRDLIGYGRHRPDPQWPGGARVAVQFVLNVEEGGERCVLEGDPHAETFLSEIINAPAVADRHMSMESIYEFGSRVGVWRVLDEFRRRGLPLTVFGVARALQLNPEVTAALRESGHEIACHGYRWLDYQGMDETTERRHMQTAIEIFQTLIGHTPEGWYTGRDSPQTRRLVVDQGHFLYDSDYYGDELPFWKPVEDSHGQTHHHLVVPYTLDCNDMRFATPQGFNSGEPFFAYLRDSFDVLYAEGEDRPGMMSVGLHPRLVGRPGRFRALQRFLDHIERHADVWVSRRIDIARHWQHTHPAPRIAGA
jgi:putative urate catabolism protein